MINNSNGQQKHKKKKKKPKEKRKKFLTTINSLPPFLFNKHHILIVHLLHLPLPDRMKPYDRNPPTS